MRLLSTGGPEPVPAAPFCGAAGTSFKPQHLEDILANRLPRHWFEVHAENYMVAGGPRLRDLERLRSDYAISIHGVGMSIGGAQPLDSTHLGRFKDLVHRFDPALISEHLAWSTHGRTFYNDLLPLPYNSATLINVCSHIEQVQQALGRTILLENPSTYVTCTDSSLSETEFLLEVVRRTGCGLLLDINNVVVSAANNGYMAHDYLAALPLDAVGEIHLAGHCEESAGEGSPLLIDSHDRQVAEAVWRLYETVIQRQGAIPTVIEWDSNIPDWETLRQEAAVAQSVLDEFGLNTSATHAA